MFNKLYQITLLSLILKLQTSWDIIVSKQFYPNSYRLRSHEVLLITGKRCKAIHRNKGITLT